MSLTRSKAVIELGKRLVVQLDAEDDLLASWMAHDIAARMELAEEASPETKVAAYDACAHAILELWKHQSALPAHLRPLQEIEPVLRTLASLDFSRADYRYYPEAMRTAAVADVEGDVKNWLEFAMGVDYAARLAIQLALRSAAAGAAAGAGEWVELAQQAGADEGVAMPVIKFVIAGEPVEEVDEAREALVEGLERVEALARVAEALAADFRAKLGPDRPKRPSMKRRHPGRQRKGKD